MKLRYKVVTEALEDTLSPNVSRYLLGQRVRKELFCELCSKKTPFGGCI